MQGQGDDFEFLAENSVDILCRVGPDWVIRYISPSCFPLYGLRPEEIEGRTFGCLMFPEDMEEAGEMVQRAMNSGVQSDLVRVRVRRKDGTAAWIEANSRVVRDPLTGEMVEFVSVARDVTEVKLLEDRLAALAMTDGLTGLANRRAFDEALEREWRRTLREGRQLSLVMLDIDCFKQFNDLNGHQVGDECLRAVAASVRGAVRGTDVVARYGGEEIAVILPLTDCEGGVAIAEKIRAAIAGLAMAHVGNAAGEGVVTASVGVATALAVAGGSMRMPESLLQAADHALYSAKRDGRNRVATRMLIADGRGGEDCG